jgi:hypothetical protein
MKLPLFLAFLLLGVRLGAQQIVVFGEKDFYVLGSEAAAAGPADPGQAAFFHAYKADVAQQAPLESSMDLVSPPSWGKTVSATTHGTIRFHPSFPGGFSCHLGLHSLLPNHAYILTLNGNPSKAGNELLPSLVPHMDKERYFDFLIVTTDAQGTYDASLGIFLKPGDYDVRCYVKDTSDFKIVLYRDFFPFQVR